MTDGPRSQARTEPSPEPSQDHTSRIVAHANRMLGTAVCEQMPDDPVWYEASFYPVPTDDGWEPSVLLYVMLQPVGQADGMHEGTFTSPYGLTQKVVDDFVAGFALRSRKVRLRLAQAREQGVSPAPLAVEVDQG